MTSTDTHNAVPEGVHAERLLHVDDGRVEEAA